jgi:carbonic anhydrase/acetyltransferase-like protein (isoleucine patch superfamily)
MYGAVLDAEGSSITIGEATIVAENAVLRATAVADTPHPVVIGDHVFIGPQTTLLGCDIGRCVYFGTGATVLQGARLGAGAVVAVGALVHANAVLPEEFFVAPMTVAVGNPVRVVSPDRVEEMTDAVRQVNFAASAFGIETDWEDRITRYEQIAEVRSREFAAHTNDEIITPG